MSPIQHPGCWVYAKGNDNLLAEQRHLTAFLSSSQDINLVRAGKKSHAETGGHHTHQSHKISLDLHLRFHTGLVFGNKLVRDNAVLPTTEA